MLTPILYESSKQMKAIIQGEFHTSGSDREALLSHTDGDADALFIERRKDDYDPEQWTIGYVTFLTGVFTVFWIQDVFGGGPDVAEKASVPVHDEIDTPLPELYPRFPLSWTIGSGLLATGAFLFGLFSPLHTIPFISLPPLAWVLYTLILKVAAVVGAFLLFSFFLIYFEERRIGSRDRDMAQAITEISSDKGYETVVVSCGAAHLNRLPKLLEEDGWDVEVNDSEHSGFAKVWRWGKDSQSQS